MTVYREDFGKEVGRVNEAGDKYKAEKILAHPLLQPIETHVDRLGLLRASRRSRKTNRTFVVDELVSLFYRSPKLVFSKKREDEG